MTIGESMLPEFDLEMATTRRVLERVPTDKGEWKPHPKSFPLGHLAQLVAGMPSWITNTLKKPELNLADYRGYSFEPTSTLLEQFDKNVRDAREALGAAKDDDFAQMWSLKRGDQVFWTQERGTVVRTHFNHIFHHRGQLTVYLRLIDVPVPSIYGPTADEGMPI